MSVSYTQLDGRYVYKEADKEKICEYILGLADTLSTEEQERFAELFTKLTTTEDKGGPGSYQKDWHLADDEREELAGCIKKMKAQHIIRWRERSIMCTPPSMHYTIRQLPRDIIVAAHHSIACDKERLMKNGVTSWSIGRISAGDGELGPVAVNFTIDESVEFDERNGYFGPNVGPCGTGAPRYRTPYEIGGFYVLKSSDDLEACASGIMVE